MFSVCLYLCSVLPYKHYYVYLSFLKNVFLVSNFVLLIKDPLDEVLLDMTEKIPFPEPVPDDSKLSVIVFKNNKMTPPAEICSLNKSRDESTKMSTKKSGETMKYAIFDPSGLKSELDKYKEEVKQLRKDNYGLKIKNQSLRNERTKLSKKVEVRDKLMETRRRKAKKDIDTIVKLRSELSKLRQLRNKMRRREYNRKAKHEKVLERRKKRRQFIQKQIELGVMDKSQLSLVYSRKKLPYEQKHTNSQDPQKQPNKNPTSYHQIPISMSIVDPQSNRNFFPTPTVEYIIEHDSQIENTLVEGETVVEVGSYYETLSNKNVVTDQETDAAVAEISSNNIHHGMDQSTTGSVTNYEASYVAIANEEESTTASSHPKNVTKPVSIIQLQQPLKSTSSNIVNKNTEEGSAEHLDFIVEVQISKYSNTCKV